MINKINEERQRLMSVPLPDLATRTSGKEIRRTTNKIRAGCKAEYEQTYRARTGLPLK
jgi:hypothetical protein